MLSSPFPPVGERAGDRGGNSFQMKKATGAQRRWPTSNSRQQKTTGVAVPVAEENARASWLDRRQTLLRPLGGRHRDPGPDNRSSCPDRHTLHLSSRSRIGVVRVCVDGYYYS